MQSPWKEYVFLWLLVSYILVSTGRWKLSGFGDCVPVCTVIPGSQKGSQRKMIQGQLMLSGSINYIALPHVECILGSCIYLRIFAGQAPRSIDWKVWPRSRPNRWPQHPFGNVFSMHANPGLISCTFKAIFMPSSVPPVCCSLTTLLIVSFRFRSRFGFSAFASCHCRYRLSAGWHSCCCW